ncbi:hypothetical protein ES707_03640 [subsurface metagenome]
MSKPVKPMTREELEARTDIPEVHKKAIEHAIWEGVDPDDPEDKVWPDYFRAAEVECQLGCQLSDDDELEDDEYETDCVWFAAGWKAREKAQQKLL